MLQYLFLLIGALVLCFSGKVARAKIEKNTINEDGSFSFRHANYDIGSYYHSAMAGPDNIVRGRYGSRNPATGQVEEVVYTAGPRGFRANGPKIHRQMDLAQYPVRPRGSPDDPLADPYDDPSYNFSFRSGDQSRTENSDSTGRVRGLYSYLDDVGERHSVRYAAGAGTGFEVFNSVPDNPASVAYAAPLYKAPPKTRGKMTTQRGPDGTYKLIAAGPDHRRAESRSSDGFVRGTYSYLDDTGVQRTVEYIAGPGIGYRIVKNRMGPGSHINPSITEFRLSDMDFKLANDFGRGASGSVINDARAGSESNRKRVGGSRIGDGDYLKTGGSSGKVQISDNNESNDNTSDDGSVVLTSNSVNRVKSDRVGSGSSNRGTTRYGANGEASSGGLLDGGYDYSLPRNQGKLESNRKNNHNSINSGDRVSPKSREPNNSSSRGSAKSSISMNSNRSSGGYNYNSMSTLSDTLDFSDDDLGSLPPLITSNQKILQLNRDREWAQGHRDSTVIKNVGKWYLGLPPGHSVRAHVQNIDLLPLGGRRVPSPSEALRQDEIADMMTSMESGTSYNS
ncbi:uncharacterized protein LOC129240553 isoform X1 [Anastrepha obliqua]|uniref:uncharacterized protein LOC129240553 isoform X1 n=3 Tax=Anastrepha obliqua TaxID=95512 RepID=UPI0024091FAB|nr:uncharacterized protein LOC129240553 isoform X1 [Anastrepha obliqua]